MVIIYSTFQVNHYKITPFNRTLINMSYEFKSKRSASIFGGNGFPSGLGTSYITIAGNDLLSCC